MGFRLANIKGRAALVADEHYYDLEIVSEGSLGPDPMDALRSLPELSDISATLLSDAEPTGKLYDVRLEAPVPRPGNVFAVGLNYRKHAEEANMNIPNVPMMFSKYPSCITGPTVDIDMRSDYCDFEAELVVVIGPGGKDISISDGWSHVSGLCVGQDFTDRAIQFNSDPPQFGLGKSLDTFGPIGPILVSPDELDDPNSLEIECVINGEVRQKDNTSDLIFDVPTLVSYLSQLVTLKTGDLIFTGTPAGVGAPDGRFLKDGDVVITTIEGLGATCNVCVRGDDHPSATAVPEFIQKLINTSSEH